MKPETPIHDKIAISKAFSRAAKHYDQYAFVQQEIGQRLLERCEWLKTKPNTILDLGSGTGTFTHELQALYPKADIIGLDRAMGMCEFAQKKYPSKFFKKTPNFIGGDMEVLPFRSNTFDLIISNCAFEWSRALPLIFADIKRLLKNEGVLLFTTMGPDTLYELATSAHAVDGLYHVNAFLDMHHIGDILLKSGLLDPVMDRETMTIAYTDINTLLLDIKKSGSGYLFQKANSSYQGKQWLKQLTQHYDDLQLKTNEYPATVEIIYGHAFKKSTTQTYLLNSSGVAHIPAEIC